MSRLLITYENLHTLLTAEKSLRDAKSERFKVRPTPTPARLTASVCSISLEILAFEQKEAILEHLSDAGLAPSALHEITDG